MKILPISILLQTGTRELCILLFLLFKLRMYVPSHLQTHVHTVCSQLNAGRNAIREEALKAKRAAEEEANAASQAAQESTGRESKAKGKATAKGKKKWVKSFTTQPLQAHLNCMLLCVLFMYTTLA